MAIVAPFMINCWIATGDPFYAINNHTDFYLKREGTPEPAPISAFEYALDKFERRPISAIDTVATGVFFYPFTNKWVGLDAWQKGLGTLLAVFAILGLIEWLWLGEGRLLLFMLLGALIPFSVTWTVLGGAEWRLTLFIYSFLLLAAFWFVDKVIRTAARGKPSLAPIARRLVVTAVVAMVLIVWTYAVPYAVESEALTIGSSTNILTTRRNQWLVHHGWSRPFVRGNVTARFATEPVAHMRIPLPESRPVPADSAAPPAEHDRSRSTGCRRRAQRPAACDVQADVGSGSHRGLPAYGCPTLVQSRNEPPDISITHDDPAQRRN